MRFLVFAISVTCPPVVVVLPAGCPAQSVPYVHNVLSLFFNGKAQTVGDLVNTSTPPPLEPEKNVPFVHNTCLHLLVQ